MKAIVTRTYGGPEVLKLEEVPKPEPKDNEVLIKVVAAGVNAADWHTLRADPWISRFFSGLFAPKDKILGVDVSGIVEKVGANVTGFQPGDEVYADLSKSGLGGFAEWTCCQESTVAKKPENMSFEEAAAVPTPGVTALQALRDHGKIAEGMSVAINGASGGVGSFSVQFAKAFGAHVTAICSTRNVEMVRGLGADEVIDYTKEDFTRRESAFQLIHGANGYQTLAEYKRALAPGGTYIMSGGTTKQMFDAILRGPFASMGSKKKLGMMIASPNSADLIVMKELIEAGKVAVKLDRTFSLPEVPDAIRYLEQGKAQGKVVVTVSEA